MNRRDALKGLGLSLGCVVATPAIISMLQGCKTEVASWIPTFLSVDQGYVLQNLVDLILPQTSETPGALDVNVPEFIDLYVSKTTNNEAKLAYKKGLDAVLEELGVSNKKATSLKIEDFDKILSKYLRSTPEQQKAFATNEDLVFKTLKSIRESAVWAYISSEEIGENVLAYDPIPGIYKGCIPLTETKGKAWSL